jgi:hypothetical protein
MSMQDPDYWTMLVTVLIGLTSGFVSVTRQMIDKQVVPKLWIASQFAGVVLITAIAIDMYPVLKPHLPHWITQWLFVGVMAQCGSEFFYAMRKKVIDKIKEI